MSRQICVWIERECEAPKLLKCFTNPAEAIAYVRDQTMDDLGNLGREDVLTAGTMEDTDPFATPLLVAVWEGSYR